ncbi:MULTISPECIES: hypothetical protein [unclassified Bradyrhizobium]|uniref:hypothetical protein n=1 Tax=unclassified Bradyrhizobium TaxID=2631580 RepID=UPI001431DC70|nr:MULTISPECIES: hypothetical protein [unclassified Bradyrhizobium]
MDIYDDAGAPRPTIEDLKASIEPGGGRGTIGPITVGPITISGKNGVGDHGRR